MAHELREDELALMHRTTPRRQPLARGGKGIQCSNRDQTRKAFLQDGSESQRDRHAQRRDTTDAAQACNPIETEAEASQTSGLRAAHLLRHRVGISSARIWPRAGTESRAGLKRQFHPHRERR